MASRAEVKVSARIEAGSGRTLTDRKVVSSSWS
jgi:hypothetical protein